MKLVMAGSSFSSLLLGSLCSCFMLLFLSSSALGISRPLPQTRSSSIIKTIFGMSEQTTGTLPHPFVSTGPADVETSVRRKRDLSEEAGPMERGAEPGHVWPRVLLDFMGHQNKFRGRTKKNTGCMKNEFKLPKGREGGWC